MQDLVRRARFSTALTLGDLLAQMQAVCAGRDLTMAKRGARAVEMARACPLVASAQRRTLLSDEHGIIPKVEQVPQVLVQLKDGRAYCFDLV